MTKRELIQALRASDAPDDAIVVVLQGREPLRLARAVFAARPVCAQPCNDCAENRHPLRIGITIASQFSTVETWR